MVFCGRKYRSSSSNILKLDPLVAELEKLSARKGTITKAELEEKIVQVLFYCEANPCNELEDRAFEAFSKLMRYAKFERRMPSVL